MKRRCTVAIGMGLLSGPGCYEGVPPVSAETEAANDGSSDDTAGDDDGSPGPAGGDDDDANSIDGGPDSADDDGPVGSSDGSGGGGSSQGEETGTLDPDDAAQMCERWNTDRVDLD